MDSEEERQTVLEETNDSPEETERVIYKIKDRESFNDEEQEQVNSDDEN